MKRKSQQGATLITALVFLVIMTLFAVSTINMSTTNFKIVGNMQAQKALDAAVQDAIEQMLSSMDQFAVGATEITVWTMMGNVPREVTVLAPVCIDSQTAGGYSAVASDIIPEDNTWEFTAKLEDDISGAVSTLHQGVEIRMLAGNCI